MDSSPPSIEVSSKLAYLQPGMYVVRLVDGALGNVLMLSATPVGRGTLDFFPGDGVSRNTLTKVGDCIVLRVNGALGSLLLTEFHKPGQQQRITVKIDHVAQENLKATLAGQDNQFSTASSDVSAAPACRLFGHVERVGDTIVDNGWLGDPTAGRRIEGFAIGVPGLPSGLSLKYGALVEGTRKFVRAAAGEFVGTRQQAKALTGVVFDLTGPQAKKYQLLGQAVFLGQSPQPIKSGVELKGKTGKEPLVALQLTVAPKESRSAVASSVVSSAWDNPAITKIKRQGVVSKPTPAKKSPVVASTRAATKKVVAKKLVAVKAVAKNATVKKAAAKKVSRKGAKK